jgi:hypothetical protein
MDSTNPEVTARKNQKFTHVLVLIPAVQFGTEECPLHQLRPETVLLDCDPPLELPPRLISFSHQGLGFERSFMHERATADPPDRMTLVFGFDGSGQENEILRGEGGISGFRGRWTWSVLIGRNRHSFKRGWLKS